MLTPVDSLARYVEVTFESVTGSSHSEYGGRRPSGHSGTVALLTTMHLHPLKKTLILIICSPNFHYLLSTPRLSLQFKGQ